MGGYGRLAVKYARFELWRTSLLILGLGLAISLPVATRILAERITAELTSNASRYSYLVGAPGSAADLTVAVFDYAPATPLQEIDYGAVKEVTQGELVSAIPLHMKYKSQDAPIVGTSRDFFSLRQLEYASGEGWSRIGDCVLGAWVADEAGLKPGDFVVSDRSSFLRPDGSLPLKLRITGVLKKLGTADDRAIFVNMETAWLLDGLGHGHQDGLHDVDESKDTTATHANLGSTETPYLEITDENKDRFHFHGDHSDFPISAMIITPVDTRSGVIWEGRFANRTDLMVVRPQEVAEGLINTLVDFQKLFDGIAAGVAVLAVLLLVVVMGLSLRLRREEMETLAAIGASQTVRIKLILFDLLLVIVPAILVANMLAQLLAVIGSTFWRQLIV